MPVPTMIFVTFAGSAVAFAAAASAVFPAWLLFPALLPAELLLFPQPAIESVSMDANTSEMDFFMFLSPLNEVWFVYKCFFQQIHNAVTILRVQLQKPFVTPPFIHLNQPRMLLRRCQCDFR
ncbi:hypothetical protein D3C75_1061500 [compost metagenome]